MGLRSGLHGRRSDGQCVRALVDGSAQEHELE